MYKVVQWATGHVGKHAIAGIDAKPNIELIGLWVSNPDKVGRDAGELAGLDRKLGIQATNDAEALYALKPDCIVHTAWADTRLVEAIEDMCGFLRRGINVVSSCPVFLQYPYGVADEVAQQVISAAEAGGASIYVNGIDPGFGNDVLPLVVSGISERIDQVRSLEILNYATYDQREVLEDIMGFGKPMDEIPFILQPGVLTLAWSSTVRIVAKGLDVELDSIEEVYERIEAPEDFMIPTGLIPKGTQAAVRFEVRGMRNGKAVVVLEHVTRLRDDLGPDWPQPAGHGCYRVEVRGEPNYTLDLQLLGTDGDHNTAGLKATAMRLINAIPHVVAAKPGLVTSLDLPLITGAGLVAQ